MAGKAMSTKCWTCSRAGEKSCCWAARFCPVPGWTAEPTEVVSRDRKTSHGERRIRSYHVVDCPLYQKDGERRPDKTRKIDTEALDRLRYDVVVLAIRDWQKAWKVLNGGPRTYDAATSWPISDRKAKRTIRECEGFFRSAWFEMFCSVDPELLIKTLREGNTPKLSFYTKSDDELMDRRAYLADLQRRRKKPAE